MEVLLSPALNLRTAKHRTTGISDFEIEFDAGWDGAAVLGLLGDPSPMVKAAPQPKWNDPWDRMCAGGPVCRHRRKHAER